MFRSVTTAAIGMLICGCVQSVVFPDAATQRHSYLDRLNEGHKLDEVFDASLSKTLGVFVSRDCSDIYVDGDAFRREANAEGAKGMGSGALIMDGHFVVTALHLIEGSNELCVVGRGANADYRSLAYPHWCSEENDLAILELEVRSSQSFDWSAGVSVDDVVWTVGIVSPAGGFVTSVEETDGNEFVTIESSLKLIYGDSGSPLVNAEGEMVAVNTTALAERRWSPSVYATLSQRPPESVRAGGVEANCRQM